MVRVRAALYLDFDNVFGGLLKLDPTVAIQFAEDPGAWLERLSRTLTVEGTRRWLVLRCYMNPAGWVPHPDPAGVPRLYFSRFRPYFTGAGFEVIDCPRVSYTKNAADIKMVVDAVDALDNETPYDEFVIASGDSDMTPLLVRLRRADRRTTVVTPSDAAEAFVAVADRLVDSQDLVELIQGEQVDAEEAAGDAAGGSSPPAANGATVSADRPADRAEAYARFRDFVSQRYTAASGPLNLASLGNEVRRELGEAVGRGGWFGLGGFVRAVESLDLPHARFSQHMIWDESRHDAPAQAGDAPGFAMPEPMARLSSLIGLPRLPHPSWARIYEALSDYAATHEFNLTEATRWSRDRLAEEGVDVNRRAIGYVTRGVSFGGCPLYRQPPPTADELGTAFVDSVFARAEEVGAALTEEESDVVRSWLCAPGSAPSTT